MQGKLSLTTPAHIFAASPAIHKDIINKLKVWRVEANKYKVVSIVNPSSSEARITRAVMVCNDDDPDYPSNQPPATLCLPLQELDVLVSSSVKIPAIFDTGLQIIVIRQDIIQLLRVYINMQQLIKMEGANGATNWTVGCAENLTLQVGDVSFKIHAHVVKDASFGLLLRRPFQQALLCRFKDLPGGKVEISCTIPLTSLAGCTSRHALAPDVCQQSKSSPLSTACLHPFHFHPNKSSRRTRFHHFCQSTLPSS